MGFCWSTVMVNNMEESLKFYEDIVGLTIDRRFKAGPKMEIAFLGDGETKLELVHNSDLNEVTLGKDISLGFQFNSVDEMMTLVKEKGIEIQSGPFQPNPNIKYFFILDPNGLKIQIVEKSS
ncbi:VOC family protein [Clostridium bowmanii]|uniref:VOC family protein n=1 Tax=Clostridium bowmanii TaxID=132925 RepID=UPI001C0E75A8|nr:VOC family protein [Clostridium bowmanii]MBU3188230.1 VOC family protein [Clostridium bowmanii]MCA1072616.1 VOC family protein [Clostridium bowmanii]